MLRERYLTASRALEAAVCTAGRQMALHSSSPICPSSTRRLDLQIRGFRGKASRFPHRKSGGMHHVRFISVFDRRPALIDLHFDVDNTSEHEDCRQNVHCNRRVRVPAYECRLTHRSSGLGLATTKLLAENGASVAILDLQEPPETIARTRFWKCDVSNDQRLETCIKEAIEFAASEKRPVAGAVCCAGVGFAARVHLHLQPSQLI